MIDNVKDLESERGHSPHQLKLLSPTEIAVPETSPHSSYLLFCDFLTSHCITDFYICIIHVKWARVAHTNYSSPACLLLLAVIDQACES